ncbi:MAG: hypothetical protein MUD13_12795 [Candidatus Nanopelagicales bacterium]|jgi:hypothetical protein|nr:hypothetical protein [Candidatus Nanopelagicales bacterium]
MELYARQQFDLMLREAAANYAERCVHRAGGPDAALALLREDPGSAVLGRAEFVAAVLSENLLDSTAGHCFVLEALDRRTLPADPGGPAAQVLGRLAGAALAEVLTIQATQVIGQQQVYA